MPYNFKVPLPKTDGEADGEGLVVANPPVNGQPVEWAPVVNNSILDANSVLAAVTDNTPVALPVPPSTVVGRRATGDVGALPGADIAGLIPAGTYAETASRTISQLPTATGSGRVVKISDEEEGFRVDSPSKVWASVTGERLFAKALGAIGDAASHPLSDIYGSLAEAQSRYPFVTSLSQEVDWAALQLAVSIRGAGGLVFVEPGDYRVPQDLTPAEGTTVEGVYGKSVLHCEDAVTDRRMFRIEADQVTVRNLKLISTFGLTRGHQGVAFMAGAEHGTVENIWTVGMGQYGVLIGDVGSNGGAHHHKIRKCLLDMRVAKSEVFPVGIEVFPRGGDGFYAEAVEISDNTVLMDGLCSDGIKASHLLLGLLTGNKVFGRTLAGGGASLNLVSSRASVVADNEVYDARYALLLSGVPNPAPSGNARRNHRITVNGLVVLGYGVSALYAPDGQDSLTIEAVDLDNDGQAGNRALEFRPRVYNATAQQCGRDFTNLRVRGVRSVGGRVEMLRSTDSAFGFPAADIDCEVIKPTGIGVAVEGDDARVRARVRHGTTIGIQIRGDRIKAEAKVTDCNTSNTADQSGVNILGNDCEILQTLVRNTNPSAWAASTAYAVGALIRPVTAPVAWYRCVAGGTSGATEPTWPTEGDPRLAGSGQVVDGTVVWEYGGLLGHTKWGLGANSASRLRQRDNTFLGMETGDVFTSGSPIGGTPRTDTYTSVMTDASVSGTTTETALRQHTVIRGSVTRYGGLRIRAVGTCAGTAGTKTIRLKWGAVTVASVVVDAADQSDWVIEAEIWAADSESAQRIVTKAYKAGALQAGFPDYTTGGVNMGTANRTLELTGQVANTADSITLRMWTIELVH